MTKLRGKSLEVGQPNVMRGMGPKPQRTGPAISRVCIRCGKKRKHTRSDVCDVCDREEWDS